MSGFNVLSDGYVDFNTDYINGELLPSLYIWFGSLFNFIIEFAPVWIPILVFLFIYGIIVKRKSFFGGGFSLFGTSKRLPDEVVQYREIVKKNKKHYIYGQWFRSGVKPKIDKGYREYYEQQLKK